ncbi:DUF6415 family natural product biosynthesis protein [Streptomyces fuscichromogenes]|uniref:Uncharacterized protein n=1 Tax=Streptomyces fuscichromogenes TaxID=1324013 RepID=A0A918CXR1_9ACTN|nr:DUF6415 family natural product biosynthesis protein [Streptomyces fuscichromogenes]GGN46846.1 hypothetical protein GCM10011578_100040 [Streptomyces fuscichromogenes]
MSHATASPPGTAEAEHSALPPDVRAIRLSTILLLSMDTATATPADEDPRDAVRRHFSGPELAELATGYRTHIETLIPAVQARAELLPSRHPNRVSAMLCIGVARDQLRLGPGDSDAIRSAVATKLARSVQSLCRHYDRLVSR